MPWTTEQMCQRAAKHFKPGFYANLGIGMPTQVANYLPDGMDVTLHSENGMLGMGPYPTEAQIDPDLINAGKETITELSDSSYFDSATSFAMVRGGHIDLTVLGALEVSDKGDLANWMVPGKMVKGMGGAMDLVAGVKKILVLMQHSAKDGTPKLRTECTLPLTGKGVVTNVITELGEFEIRADGLYLLAHPDDVSIETIRAQTGCPVKLDAALSKAA
jgi:3-oxoacid CoA-transferase subunit B